MIYIDYCNGFPIIKVITNHFPDGTAHIEFSESLEWHTHANIIWFYENDAELFTLACVREKFESAHLYMPYCPHARMDRIKDKNTEVFTLKTFANIINSMNFSEVEVRDIHSNVGVALINNLSNNVWIKYPTMTDNWHWDCIFYPDEGACKRYTDELKLELPYTFGIKRRDWKTGKILDYTIFDPEVVNGKDVLIVDDICSRGGTFYHAAQELHKAGAKSIDLFVSHLENTVLEGDLINCDLVSHIYTPKFGSIFTKEHPKVILV